MQSSFNGSYRDSQGLRWASANIQRRWDTDPYSITDGKRNLEKNRCNQKNLIRLTIFPLMQYVYANGMRRTTQQKAVQYAGICWMQNAGGSASTTGPSYELFVFFCKRLPLSSRRTCRFAQIDAFMAFCQCTHICSVRLCLLISHWKNTYSGKYAFSVGSAASCCAWSTKALKVSGAICRR